MQDPPVDQLPQRRIAARVRSGRETRQQRSPLGLVFLERRTADAVRTDNGLRVFGNERTSRHELPHHGELAEGQEAGADSSAAQNRERHAMGITLDRNYMCTSHLFFVVIN